MSSSPHHQPPAIATSPDMARVVPALIAAASDRPRSLEFFAAHDVPNVAAISRSSILELPYGTSGAAAERGKRNVP